MQLTKIEMEIMQVLWKHKKPLKAEEIIRLSPANKKWKDSSIHIIMRSLLEKAAVKVEGYETTTTNKARVFKPAIDKEEYALNILNEIGVDTKRLIELLKEN